MFCLILLLQDEKEYEIHFFQSSHKFVGFFFLWTLMEKNSLNILIYFSFTLSLSLSVKNWLLSVFLAAAYLYGIFPAILTIYKMLYPEEHKWNTFSSIFLTLCVLLDFRIPVGTTGANVLKNQFENHFFSIAINLENSTANFGKI